MDRFYHLVPNDYRCLPPRRCSRWGRSRFLGGSRSAPGRSPSPGAQRERWEAGVSLVAHEPQLVRCEFLLTSMVCIPDEGFRRLQAMANPSPAGEGDPIVLAGGIPAICPTAGAALQGC